jgi:cytochrome P450
MKTAPRLPGNWLGLRLLMSMRRDFLGAIGQIAAHRHDLCWARIGPVRAFFINHPELIHEVLVTKGKSFRKVPRQTAVFRSIEGNGLVVSEGDFWLRQRRLVQPAFDVRRFDHYGELIVDQTRQMLDSWADGQIVSINDAMTQLAMTIIGKVLFDVDVTNEAKQLGSALEVLNEFLQVRSTAAILPPEWLPLPLNLRKRRAQRVLDEFIWRTIRQRRASGEDRGDLLSMLLLAVDEEGDGGSMSDENVRDEALTLFYAGHDSSASVLAWAWFSVARCPDVQHRLLTEIDAVLGGRSVRYEDVPRLPYTECVVKETLRLYPPATGLIARDALEDVAIGEYTVPKGAWVYMFPWVLHRDPRFFDSPEEFEPDRFAPPRAERIPPHAWLPFGLGPHVCIGQRFALMEMVLILATIMQRCRLELAVAAESVTPEFQIFCRPRGLLMQVSRR